MFCSNLPDPTRLMKFTRAEGGAIPSEETPLWRLETIDIVGFY